MPRITALWVYPVKSCRGIPVGEARVVRRGFEADRRWMLAGPDGDLVSQRDDPRLTWVEVAWSSGSGLRLAAPGTPTLSLPLEIDDGPATAVELWGDRTAGVVHDEGSAWFSRYLGRPVRLVHMPDRVERQVDPSRSRPGDIVSFADGFPFLLASEESLAELNRRIGGPGPPLGMRRFRPNIVVAGVGAPFAEDRWREVGLGRVPFAAVKPCARCAVTTVDPETARYGKEPLRTLATFRRGADGGVLFGMNLVHRGEGVLRVGDEVTVATTGEDWLARPAADGTGRGSGAEAPVPAAGEG